MDGGSSLNILYAHTLHLLGIGLDQLRPSTTPFHGVAPGKRVQPLGQIDLPVWFGTPDNYRKKTLTFEVVGFRGAYHAILGRPRYAKFMAVPNYTYLDMKMLGPNGVITMGSSIEHAFDCDVECVEHAEALALDEALVANMEKMVNEDLDSAAKHAGSFEAAEQTKEVPLDPAAPEGKALMVSSTLDPKKEVVLIDFLCANADIFTWSPSDMPGIPREVAEHSLNILPHSRAVQQRLRRFDEERRRAIGVELRKLLEAWFIKEVFHPTLLANPVLVKKKNGKWRMCVDYTSLNKACPKVPFPLPRINQIVDSTAGCELLCFLDAYFGYHQIKMKESDQLATLFITSFGMYCYVTMSLGLRNAGATYQRCMQHVFGDHIGRTVEAYVDDIVVKTRKADDLVSDLHIAFGCLQANGVKLKPEKCVFGVPQGMLLGHIFSQRGIEANPEKVAALERMGSIRDLKGVQRVLGCLAALSRFISRLGEKGLPLYRLLKKHERFSWTTEAQEALDKLKVSLTHAPILTSPQDSEPLYLYVAATTQVVSTVIVVERTEEDTLCRFSGRCTASAKSCPTPRRATRKSRSCFT
jgi:hypothetical protein